MAKIIVANWKMNPQTRKEAEKILAGYVKLVKSEKRRVKSSEIVICPPFVYLSQVSDLLKIKPVRSGNYKLRTVFGAQDIFWEKEGAFTGEISAAQIKDLKCSYVIIGHSERRKHLGETDEIVNKKVLAALKAGLNVILCVGERQRENHNEIPKIVEEQVAAALTGISKSFISKITVAYEPVWAIGSGMPDTPQGAMSAAVLIRKIAVGLWGPVGKNLRVIYGGSVNSLNAASFISQDGIDGVLVGGASLNPVEFIKIISSVA